LLKECQVTIKAVRILPSIPFFCSRRYEASDVFYGRNLVENIAEGGEYNV